MQRLAFVLLTLTSLPALSDELRIDPARLQEQVQQRSEHAAQQGAAPSAPAEWLVAPSSSHAATGQGGMGHGAGEQRGYGQGFDRRYGQNAEHDAANPSPSAGGMGQSSGQSMGSGRGGGQARH